MFLVEKRDGRVKARHCSNGSIQRNWYTKEESSSPTAHQESVVITSAIDAKENRCVAIVDLPNAFIQTDNEEVEGKPPNLMKVRGVLAEILIDIAPTLYKPYVVYERGQPVIYLLLTKAVYGQLRAALLFYRKLIADLTKAGFKFNPYDRCVGNKMVNGKQLTVVMHVVDIKVSHVIPKVVDNFIAWAKKTYDQFKQMKPSVGKIHDYLGVTLDFTEKDKLKMYMFKYIDGILEDFKGKAELNDKTKKSKKRKGLGG